MKTLDERILTQGDLGRDIYLHQHTGMQWYSNTGKYGKWDISGSTCENIYKTPVDMYVEVKARAVKSTAYDTAF